MLKPIDEYFLAQSEPLKSCLQALRDHILDKTSLVEKWKYKMPFYCLSDRPFCYLWIDKKRNCPYIGIVNGKNIEHPDLLSEKRAKMKILLIDPKKDIPVEKINSIFRLLDQKAI